MGMLGFYTSAVVDIKSDSNTATNAGCNTWRNLQYENLRYAHNWSYTETYNGREGGTRLGVETRLHASPAHPRFL
jgi:hypothetical protein